MGESSKGEVASDESTRRLSWRLLEENFRLGGATRSKGTQTDMQCNQSCATKTYKMRLAHTARY
jgi:hypothetical protein